MIQEESEYRFVTSTIDVKDDNIRVDQNPGWRQHFDVTQRNILFFDSAILVI